MYKLIAEPTQKFSGDKFLLMPKTLPAGIERKTFPQIQISDKPNDVLRKTLRLSKNLNAWLTEKVTGISSSTPNTAHTKRGPT